MKRITYILIVVLGSMMVLSCNKTIDKLQADPNNPTSVPPSLILGTVLTDMSGTVTNASATGANSGSQIGNLGGIASWDAVHRWNQYYCSNYDYYNVNTYYWQTGPFDGYTVMKNVIQMDKEAISRGAAAVNPYEAVGRFVMAYYYYNMTSMMGDIPQIQALEGSLNPSPAYTPQKQVFQYILNTLDTANTDLATLITAGDNSLSTTQDIYYQGNLAQWQKLVNSFKLRVLISLSNQSADADLNIPATFANIFNHPATYPVFQSQADDFEFVYQPNYNIYYFNPADFKTIGTRYNLAQTYVQALTGLDDARLLMTSEPAWKLVDSLNYAPTDTRAFNGASTGEPQGNMFIEATKGYYSFINRNRYFSSDVGQPDILAGYQELCFNIAEAMNLAWVSGNAETWYKQGIIESMNYNGLNTADTSFVAHFLPEGADALSLVQDYPFTFKFSSYYAQTGVAYAGGTTGRNQIVLQKYIASFQNSGWEAYFNQRRTGIPVFTGGSGVGNNGVVPMRWAYPITEQTQNATNWQAALTNQGFTTDDLNGKMWILK